MKRFVLLAFFAGIFLSGCYNFQKDIEKQRSLRRAREYELHERFDTEVEQLNRYRAENQ